MLCSKINDHKSTGNNCINCYYSDITGLHLGRQWRQASMQLDPTVYHCKRLLLSLSRRQNLRLCAFLDITSEESHPIGEVFLRIPGTGDITLIFITDTQRSEYQERDFLDSREHQNLCSPFLHRCSSILCTHQAQTLFHSDRGGRAWYAKELMSLLLQSIPC